MLAVHADGQPQLDHAIVAQLRTFGQDVLRDIAAMFASDVPERLARLRSAIAESARDRVLRETHGLKGSALGVGASAMADQCLAIEADALKGSFDQYAFVRLETAFIEARTMLEALATS